MKPRSSSRSGPALTLAFSAGTIEVRGGAEGLSLPSCRWDARSGCHRAPALAYADIVRALVRAHIPHDDQARRYATLADGPRVRTAPRAYQAEALAAWLAARGRGVVVLPTGAGKSLVAVMAIDAKRRSTLVVAPTLDLVRQWLRQPPQHVRRARGRDRRGRLRGGGAHRHHLRLRLPAHGAPRARFGLLVFDECHHLSRARPMPSGRGSPWRRSGSGSRRRPSGPTAATRSSWELIGKVAYRKDIVDLAGDYLADYETERVAIQLTADERAEHDAEREIYRGFVAAHGIAMARPGGWSEFIMLSARSGEGRRAMQAYRRQRELAFCASAKLDYIDTCCAATIAIAPCCSRRQRHLLRRLAPLPDPRHHAPDQGARAQRDPRRPRRGKLWRGGDLEGAQRGRRHPRGQRRHRHVGLGLGARARAAARPHPAQAGRQARQALRARHLGHERVPTRATGAGSTVLTADLVNARARAVSCGSRRSMRRRGRAPRRSRRPSSGSPAATSGAAARSWTRPSPPSRCPPAIAASPRGFASSWRTAATSTRRRPATPPS